MDESRAKKTTTSLMQEKSKALLKLKVYAAESLDANPYVEWHEKNGVTRPIYGKKVSCRVVVEPEGDGLRV
jgi:hypothetical protein